MRFAGYPVLTQLSGDPADCRSGSQLRVGVEVGGEHARQDSPDSVAGVSFLALPDARPSERNDARWPSHFGGSGSPPTTRTATI